MAVNTNDIKFMKVAINLGKKGSGFTEPNPLVGAVVVKNNRIISTGYHAAYGEEHAESRALKNVKEKNTTLYVSLEPCSHFGKTPPCTDLIVNRGVKRVVMAMKDPNPLVNGRGIKALRANKIRVDIGFLKEAYSFINRHYLKYMREKIPYVAIKAGISIDGKLTDDSRRSQWITDKQLRDLSHSLRGEFSAILVGRQTISDDNPQLTVREKAWQGKKLFRVILDSRNSLKSGLNIFKNQKFFPVIVFSSKKADNQRPVTEHHFFVRADNRGLDLIEILKILAKMGIASVLVEGGGKISDSFLSQKLYDEIILFTADKFIGGRKSVEIFASGTDLDHPLKLKNREIIAWDSGYIIRGFK